MRLLKNAYEQNLARTYRPAAWRWFLFIFLFPGPEASWLLSRIPISPLDLGTVLIFIHIPDPRSNRS